MATLQNAQETQAIREANRALRMSSLGLPAARARAATQFRNIPLEAAAAGQGLAQNPFGFFRIGVGQQQASPLPAVQPVLPTGAIVAQGAGSLASSLGNLAANNALVKQINAVQPVYDPYEYQPGRSVDLSPVPRYGGGYY
jgi:hypothetical protein